MTWVIFWSSVALALGALAWVSVEVVALEKREAIAQEQAREQESIRRALWRMDSQMAPILAIEASRPYTDYKPIDATDDAMTDAWINNAREDIQRKIRSVTQANPAYANRYFEFGQDGKGLKADDQTTEISSLINTLQTLKDSPSYSGQAKRSYSIEADSNKPESETIASEKPKDELADAGYAYSDQLHESNTAESVNESESRMSQQAAESDDDSDYLARQRMVENATKNTQPQPKQASPSGPSYEEHQRSTLDAQPDKNAFLVDDGVTAIGSMTSEDQSAGARGQAMAEIGSLEPRWIADDAGAMQLVLVRSAVINGQPVVQGVWLDWDALRTDLLDSVHDVMPDSSLVAVTGPRSSMVGGFQLATIPVEFIPAVSTAGFAWRWSPATIGLLVTWIAIISTIIAVGAVLRAAIVLSERRGLFVSAVTHELRTPLTTFRLYSQMLADGMVSDETVRKDYLQILKRESERLSGIVENVLEYARLSRQRSTKDQASGVQTLSPGALIARFRPALARRAGQSNLDLVVSMDLEAHGDRTLTVDPHAVERIMMNLIENACKYAAPSEDESEEDAAGDEGINDADTRVHLDTTIQGGMLELLVADHGDGIAPGEGARIFGEFQRGWRGLSNARSGLGLGLALSRGLAREMGGDLVLTKRRGHGAEFLLTIPLDEDRISTD
tara:strand:+ start:48492 stop:50516 length:2025 start_codon:yes stop_codon:yes gene_type:complete